MALAFLNALIFWFNGKPWGITSSITHVAGIVVATAGVDVGQWAYFNPNERYQLFQNNWLLEHNLIIVIGVFLGVLLSSISAGEFSWKKIRSAKQVGLALLGGIMMGYGARLASGCNVGAFISSISSLSLHGWVFAMASFVGAYVGVKILVRYII